MRTSGRRGRPFATRTTLRRKYTSFFLFSLHRLFLSFHLSSPPSSSRHRSSHQTGSTLENIYRIYSRGAFSPPLSSTGSTLLSLSLSLPRFPSRHGYRADSLSLFLCLFALFFPLAAPLSSPFNISRRGGEGGEGKVGKEEEGEQWD